MSSEEGEEEESKIDSPGTGNQSPEILLKAK